MNLLVARTYVKLLIQQERSLSELYQLFADTLPLRQNLWKQMVLDERAHAEVLSGLLKLVESGEASFRRTDFNTAQVATALEHLDALKKEVQTRGIDARRALEYALAAENSLIEEGFFQVFEEDSDRIRTEFNALRKHTIEHAGRIKAALQKTDDFLDGKQRV